MSSTLTNLTTAGTNGILRETAGQSARIIIRRHDERGHFNHGWLDTFHTFSFGDYHDARHMGFRALRVINEDWVQPGTGFGMHGHRDMEIITYVLEGELEHRDSMGHGSILRAGDLQHMTAGTGIRHSEFNPSSDEPLRLYQIWLLPEKKGLTPGYAERRARQGDQGGGFGLVASRDGRDSSLIVHQDVDIFLASLNAAQGVFCELKRTRQAWLQVVRGHVELNGQRLTDGDGAAISEAAGLSVKGLTDSEIMLFDLA
jgi:hypothetical protein